MFFIVSSKKRCNSICTLQLRNIAARGIVALETFIKEIGLPTRWSEIGITNEEVFRHAADTCILLTGRCKQMLRNEIFELLKECK